MVSVPAGYNVYIDGLMHYPNEEYVSSLNPDDVFASGIFTQNGIVAGSGAEITTEVTNGSKDAIHIWADKKVGWPKTSDIGTRPSCRLVVSTCPATSCNNPTV